MGAAMGGPGRAQAHPLGSQAHARRSQAQPIKISFSPQRGFITDRITLPLFLMGATYPLPSTAREWAPPS
jgi:hypothetical protein